MGGRFASGCSLGELSVFNDHAAENGESGLMLGLGQPTGCAPLSMRPPAGAREVKHGHHRLEVRGARGAVNRRRVLRFTRSTEAQAVERAPPRVAFATRCAPFMRRLGCGYWHNMCAPRARHI